MATLDINSRVYQAGHEDDPDYEASCAWFALCPNPANGLADGGPLGEVPICKSCAEKVERITGEPLTVTG